MVHPLGCNVHLHDGIGASSVELVAIAAIIWLAVLAAAIALAYAFNFIFTIDHYVALVADT